MDLLLTSLHPYKHSDVAGVSLMTSDLWRRDLCFTETR